MDHSIIFIQVCPKLPLHTISAKMKPIPEQEPFKYSKWKFASEFNQFAILPKLTKNFLQFQNEQN